MLNTCVSSHCRAGHAFLMAGATDTGIEHVHQAYQTAKSLGARPLQIRARTLLESVHVMAEEERDTEAPIRSQREGLTRRQLEVAKHIAQGQTNKEVAQSLNLSPRTVDMHVGNLLDRLDCSIRSEAVSRLYDLGLLD